MVLSEFQVRDLRTVGPLIPEARTTVYKLDNEQDTIRNCAVGKEFLVMAGDRSIGLFSTNGTSGVLPDPVPSTSNKKASTAITGGSVQTPAASITCDVDIVNVALACDDRILIVFTVDGVSVVDLTDPQLQLRSIVQTKQRLEAGIVVSSSRDSGIILFGLHGMSAIESKSFRMDGNGEVVTAEHSDNIPGFSSSGEWRMNAADSLLAVSRGSDRIVLLDNASSPNPVVRESKLSGGDILSLHCIPRGSLGASPAFGPEAAGLVVAQPEVVSVFADKEGELELIFQFRDAINKVSFSTVDVFSNFLVSVSADSFSGRERLELFDLSCLKLKSAALQPVRRWDVSRLLTDVADPLVLFTNPESMSFVLTAPLGTAVLWEPVVRDQWFSVMANFEVLNKNEPYAEAEEEFDFNQDEPLGVVRTTMNRYKRTERVTFDFVTDKQGWTSKSEQEDVDMTSHSIEKNRETIFPFLQPLDAWKSQRPIDRSGNAGSTRAVFFSENARQMLAKLGR